MHCIDIHLTVFTIELQTEATTVAQAQREGLFIGGTLTAMLDAIAHGILQAMAALHEEGGGGGVELEGGWFLDTIEGGCRMIGDVIKIGIVVVRNSTLGITGTGF